ncbi:AAA family ATPase [Roseovarius aestuariivivens]|uniref:AAA family ATPase n=1 Tax=Roseovarius aestuariivivens TaxID=1888910 RepID=UPI00108036A3|nr:AAA family ATPase [Roseovarius aestuariivivens]
MQIDRLILRNFKGFEELDQRLNKRFTLIVGKNGVGKSSILDALSVAFGAFLLGIPDASSRHIQKGEVRETSREFDGRLDFISAYPAVVEAEGALHDPMSGQSHQLTWKRELTNPKGRTTIKDAREIRTLADAAYVGAIAGDDPNLPLLSYYGTGRLWGEPKRMARKDRPSRFDAYRNSHEPRVSSSDLLGWLKRMRLSEFETERPSPIMTAWRAAVESCFDEQVRVAYSPSRERLEVTFEDRSQTVAFENLSHGQRSILSMVGDIAYKSIILNPHLGAEAVSTARGIILIDEIDLHLHPTWQKLIIPALLRAFPGLQFVATTHSPFVIQSLSEGVLLDLDERELDDRVHNLPIGEIIEDVQKVEYKDRSASYMRKMQGAKAYLETVDRLASSTDPNERIELKDELDQMERRFQDPSLEAVMKIERMTRLKRAGK